MEKRWKWLKAFTKFVFSQFNDKKCSAMASELTLNNMLALVPLMTVAVSLMAVFPAFENLNSQVQELIFKNFLPEKGLAVQNYLNEYVNKSKNLSAIGFIFLIITSLLLMRSVDRSINTIWETPSKRKGISKWLAYWAMLTMAPILIAASLVASSSFAALPVFKTIGSTLSIGLPFMLTILAFTVLYVITPYSRIAFSKALIAAFITAIFFEIAKYAFAIFVTKFSTYEVIYGAITAIPLFFLWVYLSWMIVLLGVAICFGLHRFESNVEKQQDPFVSSIYLARFFAQAQQAETSLDMEQLKNKFPQLHEQTIRNIVENLIELGFIAKTENEHYCLIVNGAELTIADIYRRGNWRLPNSQTSASDGDFLAAKVTEANSHLDKKLSILLLKADANDTNI